MNMNLLSYSFLYARMSIYGPLYNISHSPKKEYGIYKFTTKTHKKTNKIK